MLSGGAWDAADWENLCATVTNSGGAGGATGGGGGASVWDGDGASSMQPDLLVDVRSERGGGLAITVRSKPIQIVMNKPLVFKVQAGPHTTSTHKSPPPNTQRKRGGEA